MYADSTAVLGPLATYAEPHCYDLCTTHAGRLTVPLGWEVLRLTLPSEAPLGNDDLYALARAVREKDVQEPLEPSEEVSTPRAAPPAIEPGAGAHLTRRHLRVLREGNMEP